MLVPMPAGATPGHPTDADPVQPAHRLALAPQARTYGYYDNDYYYGGAGTNDWDGQFGDDYAEGREGSDTLIGGSGDDRLYGDRPYDANPATDGVDSLYGDGGDDALYGGAKNDWLYGGDGNDAIYADGGSDRVYGGAGVDLLSVNYKVSTGALTFIVPAEGYRVSFLAPGGITVTGVERWEVRGTDFADTIQGWRHDDNLRGGLGTDTLQGLGGDDQLDGGYGRDSLAGGSGDDTIYGDQYDSSESGTSGGDTIDAGIGDDDVYGGGGADSVLGGGGSDDIFGEDDGDRLDGGLRDDDIYGGDGADIITGGAGNDSLYSQGAYDDDDGTLRDDISAGAGSDFVSIGANDRARGGDQAGTLDVLRLTFGTVATAVTYDIGARGQLVTGLANGANVQGFEILDFRGGDKGDDVTGGIHDDTLNGGYGHDVLDGGDGDDILDGGTGNDVVSGGVGNDSFTDTDIDKQDGVLIPDVRDNYYGGAGQDVFTDGYGADRLFGGANGDTFHLGPFLRTEYLEADTVDGGAGLDLVDYGNAQFGVVVNLADQSLNDGAAYKDRLVNVEAVEGSSDDDELIGNGAANSLYGGGADDVLEGGGGADWIEGGSGADELKGGEGQDTFVLRHDRSYYSTTWPHDTVVDFRRGTDTLAIDDSDFGVTAQTFALVNSATANTTSRQGPTFIFEQDSRRLWFDLDGRGFDEDGDGTADVNEDPVLIATFLNAIPSLSGSDFALI